MVHPSTNGLVMCKEMQHNQLYSTMYTVQITLKYDDSFCGLSNYLATLPACKAPSRAQCPYVPNVKTCQMSKRARRQNVPNVPTCQTSKRAKRQNVPNVKTCQTTKRAKRQNVPTCQTCQTCPRAKRPDVPFRPHPKAPSAGCSYINIPRMPGVTTCQASPPHVPGVLHYNSSYSTRFRIPTYHKARRPDVHHITTPHVPAGPTC